MDDLNILLPCGFNVKYKEIFFNKDTFTCPICKTHQLTIRECLNIKRNGFVLAEKKIELKKKKFLDSLKEIEEYKNNFEHFIQTSHRNLKDEIYFRRETIKFKLNKKIDDYCDNLIKKVDVEQNFKIKKFERNIKLLQVIEKQIVRLENEKILDHGLNVVTNARKNLTETKFRLTESNRDIYVEDLFGELFAKEETTFIFSQDEATIQFVINDFSKLIDRENFKFYSKKCKMKYIEWSIYIKLMYDKNGKFVLGFYLQCDSKEGLGKFSIKIISLLSLLDVSNPVNHLTKSFEYSFVKQICCGFSNFIEIDKLINPKNGYYNSKKDSVYLKASIRTELSEYEIFEI